MRFIFLCCALLSGILFFTQVEQLWPLGHHNLTQNSEELEAAIKDRLAHYQIDIQHYQRASRLRVDDAGLSYLESIGSEQACRQLINDGLPIFYYRLSYKKAKDPISLQCAVHPNGNLLGWDLKWPRDHAATEQSREDALNQAKQCLHEHFELNNATLVEESSRSFEQRSEHRFTFSYVHQEAKRTEEEIHFTISGNQITKAWRSLLIPAKAERELHSARAANSLIATIGFAIFSLTSIAAVICLIIKLNNGQKLYVVAALYFVGALSIMLLINNSLQSAMLFEYWDPLWPAIVSYSQLLLNDSLFNIIPLVPLFAFIVLAQHIDEQHPQSPQRMRSFWLCLKGNFADPTVQRSSWQGFATGFICGAVLVLSVLLVHYCFDGRSALQPRGFFYYTINSSASIITCLCFFGYIACLEEGAYRLFAGSYLEQRFKSKVIAIIIPALVYGMCHAEFSFLPPAEPWWARFVCLTLVGCVWGWAFFKFDALTVILSHFAADLFIFNWPLIASGETWPAAMAILSVSLPLWPFIIGKTIALYQKEPST